MGGETPRSTLGLQELQTRSNWRNPALVGIWDRVDHLGRHQHADTPAKWSGLRSEQHATPSDAGSLGGKASTGLSLHRGLSTTNLCGSPQEGEAQGISSRRHGPDIVLNIGRYTGISADIYFIQNDTIHAKIYRISFWTNIG